MRQLLQEGWFPLYVICWLASYIYLMVFTVQREFLYAERASLEYPLEVYYVGAAISCALLALVMALIFTGVILGAYYYVTDFIIPFPRRTTRH